MSTPLNKPGRELLLDAINRANIEEFTFEDITFGTPVPTTAFGRNTTVMVNSVFGGRFCNSQPIYYHRLDIGELFELSCSGRAELDLEGNFTLGNLIEQLNTKYALQLEQVDIVQPFSNVVDTDAGPITIEIAMASLVYYGSFVLHLGESAIDLDTVIYDPLLDGLQYAPLLGAGTGGGGSNPNPTMRLALLSYGEYDDVTDRIGEPAMEFYDMDALDNPSNVISLHADRVAGVAFSPDRQYMAVQKVYINSVDESVTNVQLAVYSVADGNVVAYVDIGGGYGYPKSVAWHPNGTQILSLVSNTRAEIYGFDATLQELLLDNVIANQFANAQMGAFSPMGEFLAFATQNGVMVYRTSDWSQVFSSQPTAQMQNARVVAWSRSGERLAVAPDTSWPVFYSVTGETFTEAGAIAAAAGLAANVRSLAFSPNSPNSLVITNNRLSGASQPDGIGFYNTQTTQTSELYYDFALAVPNIGFPEMAPNATAFDQAGRYMALAGNGGDDVTGNGDYAFAAVYETNRLGPINTLSHLKTFTVPASRTASQVFFGYFPDDSGLVI